MTGRSTMTLLEATFSAYNKFRSFYCAMVDVDDLVYPVDYDYYSNKAEDGARQILGFGIALKERLAQLEQENATLREESIGWEEACQKLENELHDKLLG